ncbi:hypothetical protein ACIQ7D_10110 [Streptomyces sp. NPDC096310]|uniref:hypothetical protein n=1 Tax=Streptomyces sp. NPDC096310 TaxID=3366082 RepID=UPI0038166B5D
MGRLRAVGYTVACDDNFDTSHRPAHELPLGHSVTHLAKCIWQATTTDEVADVLTELTASHDGVLDALEQVLAATAEFHDDLGGAADPHAARRLHHLADKYLGIIRADLTYTRNALMDRHAPHPGRSACTEEVPATERERSACVPARPLRGPYRLCHSRLWRPVRAADPALI